MEYRIGDQYNTKSGIATIKNVVNKVMTGGSSYLTVAVAGQEGNVPVSDWVKMTESKLITKIEKV